VCLQIHGNKTAAIKLGSNVQFKASGKVADTLVQTEYRQEDIHHLQNIAMVIAKGKYFRRGDSQAL
jgi:hypothetical protein